MAVKIRVVSWVRELKPPATMYYKARIAIFSPEPTS